MPALDFTNRKPQLALNELPSNAGLAELFAGADKVVIKDGGVSGEKAMSDTILLVLSNADKVIDFQALLQIIEPTTSFYCMCLGTYAIELYAGTLIRATIGFHHEVSIRYHGWHGDAELANSDELLEFLARQGFTKPLEDQTAAKRRMEADQLAEKRWLRTAPKSVSKYWEQIKMMDYNSLPALINELNQEIPEREQRIITLLQLFGQTDNFWTAYPSYEELPNVILQTVELPAIIIAYIHSDRNYKSRKGLGRFLCSFDAKQHRKKHLPHITSEVISDLEECFEWLGEKRGINEIFSLKNAKAKAG
ncbi:hypothetical protein Q5H93_16960 [Hymenobacter sp. ASUV-10]|uniref:Uncharacterized protein n=1 Tax=Hymenobacter aranciens TaxID=3063996 RepID=A0ABT9BDZ5_9BACT|nr:hypothetical protein [Hymenobacter sp. ASUV-10]MDO7876437.1 hypothetical protein [Hymenobacter sp. ASUV-10]